MNGAESTSHSDALNLGKLIVNLRSLELLLRLFLDKVDKDRYTSEAREFNLAEIVVGKVIPENYLTNYQSLRTLVKKHNDFVGSKGKTELRIKREIVELRDCFAHGRLLTENPQHPLRLYKFGQAKLGKVPVTHVYDLTESKMKDFIRLSHQAVIRLVKACRLFCPDVLG